MPERGRTDTLSSLVMLRSSSPAAIAMYLIGAVPFTLGLLFFFADMAQSPFAMDRVLLESLGIAILFVWKGVWQVLFARGYMKHFLYHAQIPQLAWRHHASIRVAAAEPAGDSG